MNRKDIETFAAIQNHLYEYCKNVLNTLSKDYPECGISDIARVVGIDVIDKYLQLTYSGYPCNLPLYIPLQYVEAEDVDGFCKAFAEKVRKEGKLLTQDEFIEKAYHQQWKRFYEFFDVQMTDSEADLDRTRNKMHELIETMTYVVQLAKRQGKTDKKAEFFTEKELPQLNRSGQRLIRSGLLVRSLKDKELLSLRLKCLRSRKRPLGLSRNVRPEPKKSYR